MPNGGTVMRMRHNAEAKKPLFMNSALTFSYALDTFVEKNIVFVFATFIKFSCEK